MARLRRYFVDDQPLHVVQRGNNRQNIFFDDWDYLHFRTWLAEAAETHAVAIHAYVLMTNHVHVLATPARPDSLPRMMQSIGRRYVAYVNTRHQRTGTLWEGRYRAAPVDHDTYLLNCYRYIELNPVRAGLVARPREYRWSSYAAHAMGIHDPMVRDHALFRALGGTSEERQAAYRELFAQALDPTFLDDLRAATNGGWALGDELFRRRIARKAGRPAEKRLPGPRPQPVADASQLSLLDA